MRLAVFGAMGKAVPRLPSLHTSELTASQSCPTVTPNPRLPQEPGSPALGSQRGGIETKLAP